jgi:hypothetical protein
MFLPTSNIKMYDPLLALWLLLPFFAATTVRTADACSCRPTWTINNAMHAASSVVRVWVNWEMDPPTAAAAAVRLSHPKQQLRGGGTGMGTTTNDNPGDLTLPLLDIDAPRYYMVEATHWFKMNDDSALMMELQTGKFIVKTPRHSSLCGVTLPLRQPSILFGGALHYERVPGYAADQAVLTLSSCAMRLITFPLSSRDWTALSTYQAGMCHVADCGSQKYNWGDSNDLVPMTCPVSNTTTKKDNKATTVINATCALSNVDPYWRTCQWQAPDPSRCP